MPRQKLLPAIKLGDDVSAASPRKLQQQLAYELADLLDRRNLTQEDLAHLINKPPASISKWLTLKVPISAPAAKALDDADVGLTSLGITFQDLQQIFAKANRRRSGESLIRTTSIGTTYDLFLASPMAAAESQQAFDAERESARSIADSFRSICDFRVYYAGDQIAAEAEFDAPDIALELNVEALLDVSYFVLVILEPPSKASSVLVEAGFALARNIPSIYFVRNIDYLPYILRQVAQHQSSLLPPVHLHIVGSSREVTNLVRRHGSQLMTRLSRPT